MKTVSGNNRQQQSTSSHTTKKNKRLMFKYEVNKTCKSYGKLKGSCTNRISGQTFELLV